MTLIVGMWRSEPGIVAYACDHTTKGTKAT